MTDIKNENKNNFSKPNDKIIINKATANNFFGKIRNYVKSGSDKIQEKVALTLIY